MAKGYSARGGFSGGMNAAQRQQAQMQRIMDLQKQMEETIAKYESEIAELEKRRKEILKTAKEEAEKVLRESNAKIENTIRTIKEAQAEKEKTRIARKELIDFKSSLEDIDSKAVDETIEKKMQC